MALFSLRHSVKTFSPKCRNANRTAAHGQTAAHLRYITRESAARVVIRQRLEGATDSKQARLSERAAEKRKGRACERFIIALPLEATTEQRVLLAREFAELLTNGQAGYVLAIHDKTGNDRQNPHFHLAAFDLHLSSGGRGRPKSVLGMARKNAVEKRAAQWATLHNRMMHSWGYGPSSELSHLSYAERGIDRVPEIHEGPVARRMHSQEKAHIIKPAWTHIDAGKSRHDANIIIREINLLKKEEQNARAHRLGKGNPEYSTCSQSGRKIFGENCRRSGRGTFPPARTADKKRCSEVRTDSDRHPTRELGDCAAQQRGPTQQPPFATQAKKATTPMAHQRGAGRRGISRVFYELIMLRDTLLARIANRDVRHSSLSNRQLTQVNAHEPLTYEPPGSPRKRSLASQTR
ncbi:MobA/MobL family protein [Sulfitobacter sp. D7]|uniref:MobA/MobL family protein n=1 Tax=Sulfitobacter sp. D7 TaxID=1968541 RepID=UPI000E77C7AD|nr:hypothetical protein B5M07_07185 [Sulfitobacter sp. D7]